MLTSSTQQRTHPAILHVDAPILPGWVCERFGDPGAASPVATPCPAPDGIDLTLRRSDKLTLATACVRDALTLPALVFQKRTTEAYLAVRAQLVAGELRHPIRIWNLIPDIHGAMPGAIDRYMVFNAGRYAAYHDWYAGGAEFEVSMATATGVGYDGPDLIIHVLAAAAPGTPVENPRQVRAYRYSSRYGPMPPCFARATVVPADVGEGATLLVGGTSSVRGEASVHVGDVAAQTRETLANIAHLIVAARGCESGEVDVEAELRRFESMRIYHVRADQREVILGEVWPRIDHLPPGRVDVVRADICRADLLVEIEGTVSID